jgi:hypothetical protein
MKSFIVALVVSLVLGLLKKRTKKQGKRLSEKKFTIKTPSSFFAIGAMGAGVAAAILIWGEVTNQMTTCGWKCY